MSKEIYLIGAGINRVTISSEAKKIIKNIQVIVGPERIIEPFSDLKAEFIPTDKLDEIVNVVKSSGKSRIAIMLYGDTGFFSNAQEIRTELSEFDTKFIPGISIVNYFFSKFGFSWGEAKLLWGNCDMTAVDAVRRNALTFIGNRDNIREISIQLCNAGFDNLTAYVGENPGTKKERIFKTRVGSLCSRELSSNTVLIIENPNFDQGLHLGIQDGKFIKGEVPFLKSTARSVVLSKLHPNETSVGYLIGSGTDPLAVELALYAFRGRMFTFARKESEVDITTRNANKFSVGNITSFISFPNENLDQLAPPDLAFISGVDGSLEEIISVLFSLNSQIRIVLTSASPLSVAKAVETLEQFDLDAGITQVSASHGQKTGQIHAMYSENPVYIISAGGCQ